MAKRKTESDSTFIFTIARMNPPTPGHLLLIRKLIDTAIEKGMQHVYVILTKTQNNDKDPISCSEKQDFLNGIGKTMVASQKRIMIAENKSLKEQIENIEVHVDCVTGYNPVAHLMGQVAEDKNITNLILIVGEDRVDSLGKSITGIFKKLDKAVEIIPMKRTGMANLITSSAAAENSKPAIEAISASYVRNLVRNILSAKEPEKFERLNTEFRTLYEPYLSKEKITELFEAIVNGFTTPVNKAESANKSENTKKRKASKSANKSNSKPTKSKKKKSANKSNSSSGSNNSKGSKRKTQKTKSKRKS